jgi:hypothetical protein
LISSRVSVSAPDPQEGAVSLDTAKQVLDRFRPDLETETGTQLDKSWNRKAGCVAIPAPTPRSHVLESTSLRREVDAIRNSLAKINNQP